MARSNTHVITAARARLAPPGGSITTATNTKPSAASGAVHVERRHPTASVPEGMARRVRRIYWAMAAMLAVYAALVVAGDGSTTPLVDNWGVAAFELTASLLCLTRAAVSHRGRTVTLLLGLGLLSWSLGDLALAFESAGGATPPTPSVADLFYIAFYPITYVALMLLMRNQLRRLDAARWLDGAVVGLGAATVCAALVFDGVLRGASGGTAAVATNLVYPVGDLLLLVIVIGGSAVLPDRRNLRWIMLASGYAINSIGDTFNLFQSGVGATEFGMTINAIAWPISILLVSASVWLPTPPRDLRSYERTPGFAVVGVAATAALAVLFAGSLTPIATSALLLAMAALATAGVRYAMSLSKLRRLTEERHSQAITDQLTTLGNRRALFELLDILGCDDESSTPPAIAFLFVDLNRFKEVNDSFGHSVGDELLRQLGLRLHGSLRQSDLLVRLGGDEFAVVLMDADGDFGAAVAQRINAMLEEPFQLGAVRARVSASIGIAVLPNDATDGLELLRCADLAMYRAKLEGKGFAIYSEELDGRGNRMGLVEDLRVAIDRRELDLSYQPQIELTTGEVIAVEALVRWNHPRLGNVPPLEFLPLAEDAGLMNALTDLVLDKALAQCASWRAEGRELAVAVNISTTNLLDQDFPITVQQRLSEYELPPEALIVEITETTAIADFEACKRSIEQLRDMGLVVSVDDFGAGFTSLAYLSSLAVGELKLDRSFISGLAVSGEERNLALVRSTIDLAHALGLRVVAEGVEDDASLELLSELRCDHAQGYLISRPQPPQDLALEPVIPIARR